MTRMIYVFILALVCSLKMIWKEYKLVEGDEAAPHARLRLLLRMSAPCILGSTHQPVLQDNEMLSGTN